MEYIKIRFGKDLGRMHGRLQQTIHEMFQSANPLLVIREQTWRPQMDVYETSEAVVVVADVSGLNRKDLEVEADTKAVKIAGRREEACRGASTRYHLAEIAYGRFERILFLPQAVEPDKGEASYSNGILKIVLPKRPQDHLRRISIEQD